MKILLEHDTVTLSHNFEEKYIKLIWRNVIDLEIYKTALNIVADYAQKEQINYFLVNRVDLEYVGSKPQA